MTEILEKLMQDDSIRRELGQRIKQLRKDKGWRMGHFSGWPTRSHCSGDMTSPFLLRRRYEVAGAVVGVLLGAAADAAGGVAGIGALVE